MYNTCPSTSDQGRGPDSDVAVLAEQLRAIELIARDLKGMVPFLITVFTPPQR